MKYRSLGVVIPRERRAEYNARIIHAIRTGNLALTREEVANAYTGKGGLHGLNRDDYDSYAEFSAAKRLFEEGQFFTPFAVLDEVAGMLAIDGRDLVGDLTCGIGGFFNFCPVEANCYGCEIDADCVAVAEHLYPEANVTHGDIAGYDPGVPLDVVFGNPPFNLCWRVGCENTLSQHFYAERAAELLNLGGVLVMIAPLSYLDDDFTYRHRIERIDELYSFVGQARLSPRAFSAFGPEKFETKVVALQRRSEHLPARPYDNEYVPVHVLRETVTDARRQARATASVRLEVRQRGGAGSDFEHKAGLMLFHISRHPVAKEHHARAMAYYRRLSTQRKPADISPDEWERAKVTERKVVAYLRDIQRRYMNPMRQPDRLRLVKTSAGVEYRAYGPKSRRALKAKSQAKFPEYDLLTRGLPDECEFSAHYEAKRRRFLTQMTPFDSLAPTPEIREFVDGVVYKSMFREIRLTELQKADIARLLCKPYAVLSWEPGCGKTIAGMVWMDYHWTRVDNVVMVSSPKAIYQTWAAHFDEFQRPYIVVRGPDDIEHAPPGVPLFMRFTILSRCRRALKRLVKRRKCGLLWDESHRLSNYAAERTRHALAIFRRMPAKLLLSGTPTRNNAAELYPQLELLYNNSANLVSLASEVYHRAKDGGISGESNPIQGEPFPPHFGFGHWKSCFSPERTTVFGIKRNNQDVYNAEELARILRYTVISRSFAEMVGPDRYEYVTHSFDQKPEERDLYRRIMDEFCQMIPAYFSSRGSRRDAYLRIVRQMQLLIRAASMPHRFKEYAGNGGLPRKMEEIGGELRRQRGRVALGVLTHEALAEYERYLAENFPGRPVFVVHGEVNPYSLRSRRIAEFEATDDGVLLTTQQSLDESVNVSRCSQVLVESLQWNFPNIRQYVGRFIRLDSAEKTFVHFFTYRTTIEPNLLGLLTAKETINRFVRTLDFSTRDEILDEYGVDPDLFDWLIEKARDDDGRVRLEWGNQTTLR